jgi:hypothetical protein
VADFLTRGEETLAPASPSSPPATTARHEAIARIRGYLGEVVSHSNADPRVLHLASAIGLELDSLEQENGSGPSAPASRR